MDSAKGPYRPGDPYCLCDICGFRMFASDTAVMYNNLRACRTCYNDRPVNDLPTPTIQGELQPIPNARPEPTDVFIDNTTLINWSSLKSDWGIPGN